MSIQVYDSGLNGVFFTYALEPQFSKCFGIGNRFWTPIFRDTLKTGQLLEIVQKYFNLADHSKVLFTKIVALNIFIVSNNLFALSEKLYYKVKPRLFCLIIFSKENRITPYIQELENVKQEQDFFSNTLVKSSFIFILKLLQ